MKFKCEAEGRYRSEDGRTLIVRSRRASWALYHADVVGPRAYAPTLAEAIEKAAILRDGWDALDHERATLGMLRAQDRVLHPVRRRRGMLLQTKEGY